MILRISLKSRTTASGYVTVSRTLVDRGGIEGVRAITNPARGLAGSSSSTFHGWDIYSPAAGHLQRGDDWKDAGPELKDVSRLDIPRVTVDSAGIRGQVTALNGPYGGLVTNVTPEDLGRLGYQVGDTVHAKVSGKEFTVLFAKTFGAVAVGKPLLSVDSRGLASLAINQGNFAARRGIVPPVPLQILPK